MSKGVPFPRFPTSPRSLLVKSALENPFQTIQVVSLILCLLQYCPMFILLMPLFLRHSTGFAAVQCETEEDNSSDTSVYLDGDEGTSSLELEALNTEMSTDEDSSSDEKTPQPICKRYTCKTCGKSWASKQGLLWHMNIHTGERPFKCDRCPKSFRNPGTLHLHQFAHLPKKFQCEFCHKNFSQAANLKTHRDGDKRNDIACKVRRRQLATKKGKKNGK